ncbi:ankyrin repeat domain-containing protein [Flavobacterium sp. UBA7682]|uniref:ankyrin repeat domain-containing protein n=1 Tax=Flavobacterium sp. UBA7682 TaxID=1946560 RepID=UPI0025BB99E4|nr:ankyrin repeat domain-containing protein [Flavobacterium sp. UBA7682]
MRVSFVFMLCFFWIHSFSQEANCFDVARRGSLADLVVLYNSDKNVVDAIDANGSSMLILAAYYGNTEVAVFLADKVKNINYGSGRGTALMAAVVKGNIVIAKKLLEAHSDVNAVDANQSSALHFAVLFKNVEMLRLLLKFNPNLSLKDSSGATAFELAAKSNNEDIIALLKH